MATINFYLDRPDAEEKCPIFLVYQSRGQKFKYFTQEKVNPKYWNPQKKRVKSIAEASDINDILDSLEAKLKRIERLLKVEQEEYSIEDIKEAFFEKKKKLPEFFTFLRSVVEQVKSTHRVKSLREYNTVISDLKAFEEHSGTKLAFKNLNIEFFSKLLGFLYEEKENTQNTVAKKVTTLKTLLNYATKAGVNRNMAYKDFKAQNIETQKVYLENDELFAIYKHDFSNNPRLDRSRDVFCFGCFTGLRYSDIWALRFEDIVPTTDRDGKTVFTLKFHIQKTKDLLYVPLNQFALEIIEKYRRQAIEAIKAIDGDAQKLLIGRKVLPVVSNQKLNDYIKEIGELVGVDAPFVQTRFAGTKRTDITFPKHGVLATHSARRTFAILSLERGMRIEVLQKILGHRSIRTTMKYVFILDQVRRSEMAKAWDR